MVIGIAFFNPIVISEKEVNATKVPNTPNKIMFLIFAKKSPLYILNPEAKTIGGKQK
jgi:hypothetical protein